MPLTVHHLASGCLLLSLALAVSPVVPLISVDGTVLLTALSMALLILGALAVRSGSEARYATSLGGQMAWSLCALALLGTSAVALWALLFLHLILVITGIRGLSIGAKLLSSDRGQKVQASRLMLRNLLLAYEWLGASAVISALLIVLTPWLMIPGGGLALIMAVLMVALVSFALLAAQLRAQG